MDTCQDCGGTFLNSLQLRWHQQEPNACQLAQADTLLNKANLRIATLKAENERLKGVVEKLPVTADGVVIELHQLLWWICRTGQIMAARVSGISMWGRHKSQRRAKVKLRTGKLAWQKKDHALFSTEAAARAAQEPDNEMS